MEHRVKVKEWNDGILGGGLVVGSKIQTAEDARLRTAKRNQPQMDAENTEHAGSRDGLKAHAETLELKNNLAHFRTPVSHISPDHPVGIARRAGGPLSDRGIE